MNVTTARRPVISAWSAVSPFGLRAADFVEGVRNGTPTFAPLGEKWQTPAEQACLVPDFDIREVLGKKGTRSMDRVTALAVTAVDRLVRYGNGDRIGGVGEHAALVLGTNTGSAQSIMDFTRDSLVGEHPYFVDPARFPNTVMNCAAGQCAIWHDLRGPNTTIAAGRLTGLLALRYALRLQRAGHADTVLFGAAEEFSTARSWLDWHVRGDAAGPLGEGCALLLLEPEEQAERHGRTALAEVLGLSVGVHHGDATPVLARCVRRVLEGLNESAVDAALIGAESDREALPDGVADVADVVAVGDLIGDTGAASGAFQLVAALGRFGGAGRHVLLTSADHDGAVGAALLQLS
ncbi:3-oxoacyl-ACP synthase [Lentzea guizhouensis]|uniref:3-oxoacyl-ACP synthase n=1 Tax=Lentzea guizhouensis TaxID=1586287 RepID=A0A1B2HPW5_9PSEU|nr:beta-ketoacyl synthase N-terminal-like domain-containing protein [Lentzea guizhouensis]ANZ39745.1 3-oxoacyl-ACP synthase [Lentzea guizhouensis]